MIIDDTIFLDAADALERELGVLERDLDDEDPELDCLRETIDQLRAVAAAAAAGAPGEPRGAAGCTWPTVTIAVQAVSDEPRRQR